MVNPAARALLVDKQTDVEVNILPPCAIEVCAWGLQRSTPAASQCMGGNVGGSHVLCFTALVRFCCYVVYEGSTTALL